MSTETVEIEPVVDTSTTPHMLAKVVIGAIAAFAIGKLTDKAYDASVIALHNRRNGSSV